MPITEPAPYIRNSVLITRSAFPFVGSSFRIAWLRGQCFDEPVDLRGCFNYRLVLQTLAVLDRESIRRWCDKERVRCRWETMCKLDKHEQSALDDGVT